MGVVAFLAAWLTQKFSPVCPEGRQIGRRCEPRRRSWACTALIMCALWNLLALTIDWKSAQIENSVVGEPTFLIACRYSVIVCLGCAAIVEYRRLPDISRRSGIVVILGSGFAAAGTVMVAQL